MLKWGAAFLSPGSDPSKGHISHELKHQAPVSIYGLVLLVSLIKQEAEGWVMNKCISSA
jgi:hypothetical protein